MNLSTITFFLSCAVIVFVVGTLILIAKKGGMGLEKFYPLILLVFFVFFIPLIIIKAISETTFSTFIGIIIGVFVTAFTDVIKSITKQRP